MGHAEREAEIDYLRRIEGLAHAVVELAAEEPWFAFGEEGKVTARPIECAINELATQLRFAHHQEEREPPRPSPSPRWSQIRGEGGARWD